MTPEAIISAILALMKIIEQGSEAIARLREIVDSLPEGQKEEVLAGIRERLHGEAEIRLQSWDDLEAWIGD